MHAPQLLVIMSLAACAGAAPRAPSPPAPSPPARSPSATPPAVDDPRVRAFGVTLAAALAPCDTDSVAALLDRPALQALVEKRAPGRDAMALVEVFVSTGAQKLCAWMNDPVEVRLLRVRPVQGAPGLELRKVGTIALGYFDVRIADTTEGLRVVDVFSHNNGTWISEELAEALLLPNLDDPAVAPTVLQVNALDDAGKPAEALAALDTLPEPMRNTRAIQSWRVAIAGRISPAAYAQASAERARRLPDEKPSPFPAMNRAFTSGDFDEALRQIDLMDAEIGGDPLLDAMRAGVLTQRDRPGDRDKAAMRAAHAVEAEPWLVMPRGVQLGVAIRYGEWVTAIGALEGLATQLGVVVPESAIQAMPNAAAFLATPQYQAWRARHP